MSPGSSSSWQLILADLALILFLVTLSALATEEEDINRHRLDDGRRDPQVAPSQALFRPTAEGPSIAQWLAERPRDSRATLTVFAEHSQGDRDAIWQQAKSLAMSARQAGFAVRVVITRRQTSDVYASLAYDTPAELLPPSPSS